MGGDYDDEEGEEEEGSLDPSASGFEAFV